MKKLIVSFMTLVLTVSASWAETAGTTVTTESDNIKIGSTTYALTKTTKQIASGVKYITLEIPGKKATSSYPKGAKCYVIEADLTDPTVSVRHGDDYRDSQHTLTTMATTLSNDKSKVVGGVNANFWITVEKPYATKMKGEPFGVSIKDGVMYSDLNTNTAKHCGGPTKTGAMVIDGNGKCYIDWLKSQKTNNATGSGWNFNVVNPSVSSTPIALDQVNGVSCPKVASVYIKSAYGASKGFRQVTSSSDYSTTTGTSNTIVYLNFAGGDTKWNSGKQDLVIKKIEREVVVNGKTLGEYDVALVFRWEDMQSRVASWKVGQTVTITTCVNFKSQGTATSIRQAVSGNSVTMANGEIGYIEQKNYNGKIYPRTIYATNTAGTKLWLIVIEHYPNREYTYGGMTTTEATYVAKYMGATWAMQVDCGGSSQMYADGKQVSASYDAGGVRAVQSGLFILSTPDATSGGVTPPTEPEEPETPTTSENISANVSSVALSASNASVDVKITAKNLTSEMNVKSVTGSVIVTPQSDWNPQTGGTLNFALNKTFTAGSYTGYVAIQSGTNRLEIPVTAVITENDNTTTPPEEDTTTPDVENPEEETPAPPTGPLTASTTNITLTGEKGVYPAPYVDVTITGTGLANTIKYNSNTSAVVVSPEGWNEITGGVLRFTLNPDFVSGVGTYDSYVAVRSGKNDSVFIYTHVTIKAPDSGSTDPTEPTEPTEPTVTEPTLTKMWETTHILDASAARYATGYDGKVYAVDMANQILYSWNAEGSQKSEVATGLGGGYGCTVDEGGNLLLSTDKDSPSFTTWQIYDVASGTKHDLTLTAPSGVTAGLIHANVAVAGDLLSSTGGTIYLAPSGQKVAAKIVVKNGVQDVANSTAAATYTAGTFSHEHAVDVANVDYNALGAESFIWRVRNGDTYYIQNGALKTYTEPANTYSTIGFTTFKLQGVEYGVVPTGTGYSDGFTVFKLADGSAVASRTETKVITGNPYGSVHAEKVSATKVNIYFYKSGVSCGMYTFQVPKEGSPTTATEIEKVDDFGYYTHNNTLFIEGVVAQTIDLYNIAGQKVCAVQHTNELSVAGLMGMYVVTVQDTAGMIYTGKIMLK